METQMHDTAKAEAFSQRMLDVLNHGFLIFLVSLGHKTKLFDTMAELPPATTEEIARAAALNERYVREWLGAMSCGRIVEYDARTQRYRLPPEHAAYLTRAAGPNNFAMFTQYAAEVGKVEDLVAESFRTGRGVPYSAYPKIHQLHREESRVTLDTALVQEILPLVQGLSERLEAGIDVMDVGCGAGHAVNLLAQRFPQSRFVGYDLSEEGIALARAEAALLGVKNAHFDMRDAACLDDDSRFDLVTAFDAIHDQARPQEVLNNIYRALRTPGTFLMLDTACSSDLADNLDHPLGALLYSASTAYCMSVSLAYGGPGLGTMWGKQTAARMLREAGFSQPDVKALENDVMHAVFVASKT
jgi:ubiquinone/menaquinone biosynthesis C-methylase UbiE